MEQKLSTDNYISSHERQVFDLLFAVLFQHPQFSLQINFEGFTLRKWDTAYFADDRLIYFVVEVGGIFRVRLLRDKGQLPPQH
jgi:hypothetical protein